MSPAQGASEVGDARTLTDGEARGERRRIEPPPAAHALLIPALASIDALESIPPTERTAAVTAAIAALQAEIQALRRDLSTRDERMGQLERAADHDPLLPVLNRRAFTRELGRIKSFVERYETEAALIFVDLDRFKDINDRYGHAAGDRTLFAVADLLKRNTRESDVVGRLGGDEFGLILSHMSLDLALKKADTLARLLDEIEIEHEGARFRIRASFGACAVSAASDVDAILAAADQAMYGVKRLGKSDRPLTQ